ncbi:MAG TPA: agmatinase [Bacteroidales bacterium]|nr:agmatinase [Bacteroidales bacterium]
MNFADIPDEYASYEQARIVVLPVPFDGTSTWMKGADKGPAAIFEASCNMELYDIETDSQVFEKGIFQARSIDTAEDPKKMVNVVYQKVKHYIRDDKFVVLLGGEHSVTIGSVIAFAENFNELCVLQLDAHTDLRPDYQDSIYNHACVISRVRELCPVIQVGIRSMDISEVPFLVKDNLFLAEHIQSGTDWIEQVVSRLTRNVYITIDLDVFDPSIMPSTGTPEPGGLLWYPVLNLLKRVAERNHIVGFDVVELCPAENNKAPDFLAAKLVYKLLSYKYCLTD